MEPIYVVLIINLIVWTGIFGFVFFMNKSLSELKLKIRRLEGKDKN